MPHQLDGKAMKMPKTSKVLVDSVSRGGNQGSLTGDAMLRMANGMRAKFDENDQWVEKDLVNQGIKMPLKSGSDRSTVSHNIGKLISEGYSKDQASAIAFSKAGRAKKGKK